MEQRTHWKKKIVLGTDLNPAMLLSDYDNISIYSPLMQLTFDSIVYCRGLELSCPPARPRCRYTTG